MAIELVTLDCAETMVPYEFDYGRFACACLRAVGIDVDEQVAAEHYQRLVDTRWTEYWDLHAHRDDDLLDRFWRDLVGDWMDAQGIPTDSVDRVLEAMSKRLFGPDPVEFWLYDDVVPVLDALDEAGVRVAVVSNWDYTLPRILKGLDVHDRFERVFVSMTEQIEKPDPRLFELVLDEMGVLPDEALHVGDNPVDDVLGAKTAGMKALLIDRQSRPQPGQIQSLLEIPNLLWRV